jgi:hypothetical protein
MQRLGLLFSISAMDRFSLVFRWFSLFKQSQYVPLTAT